MAFINEINSINRIVYETGYFSGDFNHIIYLKKAVDSTDDDKYYLDVRTIINGQEIQQAFLYFYLDISNRTSRFIGIAVKNEYRNMNIASLLVSLWIDFCFNNGIEEIKLATRQRKPFILYLLKTYGFEVADISLYDTRDDVITICRKKDDDRNHKGLLFKDPMHEAIFKKTNVFKADNYLILDSLDNAIKLDNIILPLQDWKRNHVDYDIQDLTVTQKRVEKVLSRHRR